MSTCPRFTHIVVLPHLHVQDANAISSPLTHGFPSITAFLGLMWALARKAQSAGMSPQFKAVGVVCHDYQEQVADSGSVERFHLRRPNVATRDDLRKFQNGSAPAIIEEGRIHLDVSLLLAVDAPAWDDETRQADLAAIANFVYEMRIAGGSVLPSRQSGRAQPFVSNFTSPGVDDQRGMFRDLRRRVLPGSALVARDELIDQRLGELQATTPEATRLDAWLSLSRVNWHYDADAEDGKGAWQSDRRKGSGWIVPMPVGYGALGALHDAGSVANARDTTTPFRFVESLYSIGEWIGPHRLEFPQDLLWYADSRPDDGLYRCRNDYRAPDDDAEFLFD